MIGVVARVATRMFAGKVLHAGVNQINRSPTLARYVRIVLWSIIGLALIWLIYVIEWYS